MKKFVKLLLLAVGLLLIAVAVCALVLRGPLESACKDHIEQNLTRIFGAETTVEGVSFVPWRQEIDLTGLAVANPEGFKEGTAMRFDRIVVRVNGRSLFSQNPVVDSATLLGGHILLRYEVGKGTNLERLGDNAAQAKAANQEEQADASPVFLAFLDMRREFIIKEVAVEKAQVELSTNLIPLSSVNLDLVSFTLQDVSKDKPVSTAELAGVFIRSLLKEVVTLKGILGPVAEAIGKEIGGWFEEEDNQKPAPKDETAPSPGKTPPGEP